MNYYKDKDCLKPVCCREECIINMYIQDHNDQVLCIKSVERDKQSFFSSYITSLMLICVFCLVLMNGCAASQNTDLHPEVGPDAVQVADARIPSVAAASEHSPVFMDTGTVSDEYAFEDYEEEAGQSIADPLEGWNRFWFGFNDILILRVIKPVYTGYTHVMPQAFRSGLSNFFYNLRMPVRVANYLLQGKIPQAGVEIGRFLVNTTAGFGGFIDVTKDKKVFVPMNPQDADFGQTLRHWGMGEGFYLVWPFLGPSTVRDTVGMAGDFAASPFFWSVEPVGPVDFRPALAANLGLRFNDFGSTIQAYEAITKGAIEPYVAAREAYVNYRRGKEQNRSSW